MRNPTIRELYELCRSVKGDIADEFRCTDDPEDDQPGIRLTVGADAQGGWSFQTGDNSFSGGAYHYPHWGIADIYRTSNCMELARAIKDEIEEAIAMSHQE